DKKFEVKASLGAPDGQLRPLYGKLNQELMKRITSNNSQPFFVADTSKDEYFKNLRRGGKRVKSLILVPIKRKNKLIGVLSVDKINSNSQFVSEDADLLAILAGQVAVSIENATLYEQLHDLFLSTIQALAQTIEVKDEYTRGHSERVTKYAVKVARALSLPEEIIEAIRHACILHDIGKIAVEEAILKKTASLSAKERSLVERHPKISAEILKPIAFLKDIIPIVYHHHERYDGSGYLDSLKRNEIPVGARILAVVDAYEAMTSDRPYRRCMPKVEAIAELKKGAGKQFDPEIVKIFLSVLEAETRG
ncbi:MAG: HD domain-containing phosphohydrolase, partial [Candidatus Subteraquimicrobiales bacterium]|nr:HD domain-containing phosphohydrolase [Candidatus Subteraquimicrobiales bacterium]